MDARNLCSHITGPNRFTPILWRYARASRLPPERFPNRFPGRPRPPVRATATFDPPGGYRRRRQDAAGHSRVAFEHNQPELDDVRRGQPPQHDSGQSSYIERGQAPYNGGGQPPQNGRRGRGEGVGVGAQRTVGGMSASVSDLHHGTAGMTDALRTHVLPPPVGASAAPSHVDDAAAHPLDDGLYPAELSNPGGYPPPVPGLARHDGTLQGPSHPAGGVSAESAGGYSNHQQWRRTQNAAAGPYGNCTGASYRSSHSLASLRLSSMHVVALGGRSSRDVPLGVGSTHATIAGPSGEGFATFAPQDALRGDAPLSTAGLHGATAVYCDSSSFGGFNGGADSEGRGAQSTAMDGRDHLWPVDERSCHLQPLHDGNGPARLVSEGSGKSSGRALTHSVDDINSLWPNSSAGFRMEESSPAGYGLFSRAPDALQAPGPWDARLGRRLHAPSASTTGTCSHASVGCLQAEPGARACSPSIDKNGAQSVQCFRARSCSSNRADEDHVRESSAVSGGGGSSVHLHGALGARGQGASGRESEAGPFCVWTGPPDAAQMHIWPGTPGGVGDSGRSGDDRGSWAERWEARVTNYEEGTVRTADVGTASKSPPEHSVRTPTAHQSTAWEARLSENRAGHMEGSSVAEASEGGGGRSYAGGSPCASDMASGHAGDFRVLGVPHVTAGSLRRVQSDPTNGTFVR
jgi:hypothetical protein